MTKADTIIEQARKQLKDFIVYEMHQVCELKGIRPNFEKEEDYVLTCGKDLNPFFLSIFVYDSYDDGDYYSLPANRLIMTLDENIFIVVYENEDKECDGGEIEWTQLKTDDLAQIANALEREYERLIGKK